MAPRLSILILCNPLAAVATLHAQEARAIPADLPIAVATEPFTLIKGVRELPDGRVIVTDWIEERVAVVDFEAGTVRNIGRVGEGPGEFRLPGQLLALPGDSTLLADFGNARLAVIGPELDIVRSFSMHAHGERFAMNPRAVDEDGAIYFALSPFAFGPERGRMDSVPVARWAEGYDGYQIVAAAVIKGSTARARRESRQPGMPYVAFAKQDGWAIARDGWLAIVRSDPYRVEWHGPGGEMVAGHEIPYDEIPVTMDDRRAHLRRWLASTMQSGRGEDGGLGHVSATGQSDAEVNRMARTEEFADVFPPFEPGGVWINEDGELWIRRALPEGSITTIDVVDRSGIRIAVVTLPDDRRIIGFGAGTLYATVADELGLLRLERYPTGIQVTR